MLSSIWMAKRSTESRSNWNGNGRAEIPGPDPDPDPSQGIVIAMDVQEGEDLILDPPNPDPFLGTDDPFQCFCDNVQKCANDMSKYICF